MPRTSLFQFVDFDLEDPKLSGFANNVSEVFRTISSKEILDGRLIPDILLESSITTQIQHKLTRLLNGYIIVKQSADARIWSEDATNPNKESLLYLSTSDKVTISLWVF